MVASTYDIDNSKWGLAAKLGALGLVVGSFGAAGRAEAFQYGAESPQPVPATAEDHYTQSIPSFAAKVIEARDAQDMVRKWSANTHLYVSGEVGLRREELNKLAEALKAHPNWTVYLVERCEGMVYRDADGKHYVNYEAVEHALGKEIRNTAEFSNLRTEDTGEKNGNILYITFDSNKTFRKVGYLASEAYDNQGLGERQWQGGLDKIAITPLKDGRRVYDAVMDTVTQIDSQRAYNLTHPGIVKTGGDAIKNNLGTIVGGLAAAAALAAGAIGVGVRRSKIADLKKDVKSHKMTFGDFLQSAESLSADFEAIISPEEAKNEKGDTKKLIEQINSYLTSCKDLSERGSNKVESLEKVIDPLTSKEKVGVFFSRAKTGSVEQYLEDRQTSDSIVTLGTQITEQLTITKECMQELKTAFKNLGRVNKQIDIQVDTLSEYGKDNKLSKNIAIKAGEARQIWKELSNKDGSEDPVALYREYVRFEESVKRSCEQAALEVEKYEELLSGFENAKSKLVAKTKRLKELKAEVSDPSEKFEKLVAQNKEHLEQLKEVKRQIANTRDDSWLTNYLIYSNLFDSINHDHRAADDAYVNSSGTYYSSKPAPVHHSSSSSDSGYSSSSYSSSSSSGFSSSDWGGGGGFSSGGGGGSGFSSSGW